MQHRLPAFTLSRRTVLITPRLAARCERQLRMADGRLQRPLFAGPRPRAVSGADVA